MINNLVSLDGAAGIDVSGINTIDQLLTTAGIDFAIEKAPVYTPEGDQIPSRNLIRRCDDHHILGVVGSKYHLVDTREMLKPFHEMVIDHGAKYENAGMVGGGRKIWVSATLPEQMSVSGRSDDVIQNRIVCLINHDGLGKNAYVSIAHRMFCNNQLRMLRDRAQQTDYSLRHTKNWQMSLELAHTGFSDAIANMKKFRRVADSLNKKKMTLQEIEAFAKKLYKIKPKQDISSQANKRHELLKQLFVSGAGNRGETRWDALNAVTEMLDHHSNREGKNPTHARQLLQNRFMSSMQGYGNTVKQRAVSLLMDTTGTFK